MVEVSSTLEQRLSVIHSELVTLLSGTSSISGDQIKQADLNQHREWFGDVVSWIQQLDTKISENWSGQVRQNWSDANQKFEQLVQRIDELEQENSQLQTSLQEMQNQQLEDQFAMQDQVQRLSIAAENAQEEISYKEESSVLNSIIKEQEAKLAQLEEKLDASIAKVGRRDRTINEIDQQVIDLKDQLAAVMDENNDETTIIKELQESLDRKQDELNAKEDEIMKYTTDYVKLQRAAKVEKDDLTKQLALAVAYSDDYKARYKKEIHKRESIEKSAKEHEAKVNEQKELIDNFVFLQKQLERTNQKRKQLALTSNNELRQFLVNMRKNPLPSLDNQSQSFLTQDQENDLYATVDSKAQKVRIFIENKSYEVRLVSNELDGLSQMSGSFAPEQRSNSFRNQDNISGSLRSMQSFTNANNSNNYTPIRRDNSFGSSNSALFQESSSMQINTVIAQNPTVDDSQRGFGPIQEEMSYENNKLKLSQLDRTYEESQAEGQGNYITPMAFQRHGRPFVASMVDANPSPRSYSQRFQDDQRSTAAFPRLDENVASGYNARGGGDFEDLKSQEGFDNYQEQEQEQVFNNLEVRDDSNENANQYIEDYSPQDDNYIQVDQSVYSQRTNPLVDFQENMAGAKKVDLKYEFSDLSEQDQQFDDFEDQQKQTQQKESNNVLSFQKPKSQRKNSVNSNKQQSKNFHRSVTNITPQKKFVFDRSDSDLEDNSDKDAKQQRPVTVIIEDPNEIQELAQSRKYLRKDIDQDQNVKETKKEQKVAFDFIRSPIKRESILQASKATQTTQTTTDLKNSSAVSTQAASVQTVYAVQNNHIVSLEDPRVAPVSIQTIHDIAANQVMQKQMVKRNISKNLPTISTDSDIQFDEVLSVRTPDSFITSPQSNQKIEDSPYQLSPPGSNQGSNRKSKKARFATESSQAMQSEKSMYDSFVQEDDDDSTSMRNLSQNDLDHVRSTTKSKGINKKGSKAQKQNLKKGEITDPGSGACCESKCAIF